MKLRLNNLTKKFAEVTAFADLSLEINDGELIALLGPSGCGKTTLLFCIAGIYRLNAGSIFFAEEDISALPSQKRNVGVVFQAYALYPHMSVFDNIAFPLKLRKVARKTLRHKVEAMAELVEISDLLTRRPSQLSGGQQQRVSLARALVRDPAVLLLDEPLSNLDARLRSSMRSEIKRIQREAGVTTILVTHDQIEATSMADRIVCMDKGSIAQIANPQEIYHAPANLFVASFIGSPAINLLEARADNGIHINHATLAQPHGLANQDTLTLGLRPESIQLGSGTIQATIRDIEAMGREMLYHIESELGVLRVLEASSHARFARGDSTTLQWQQDDALYFDAEGKRICLN